MSVRPQPPLAVGLTRARAGTSRGFASYVDYNTDKDGSLFRARRIGQRERAAIRKSIRRRAGGEVRCAELWRRAAPIKKPRTRFIAGARKEAAQNQLWLALANYQINFTPEELKEALQKTRRRIRRKVPAAIRRADKEKAGALPLYRPVVAEGNAARVTFLSFLPHET